LEQKNDLKSLVKDIYLELLENRAHLLTGPQVENFQTIFSKIA
jgi:hypothetical protein